VVIQGIIVLDVEMELLHPQKNVTTAILSTTTAVVLNVAPNQTVISVVTVFVLFQVPSSVTTGIPKTSTVAIQTAESS